MHDWNFKHFRIHCSGFHHYWQLYLYSGGVLQFVGPLHHHLLSVGEDEREAVPVHQSQGVVVLCMHVHVCVWVCVWGEGGVHASYQMMHQNTSATYVANFVYKQNLYVSHFLIIGKSFTYVHIKLRYA